VQDANTKNALFSHFSVVFLSPVWIGCALIFHYSCLSYFSIHKCNEPSLLVFTHRTLIHFTDRAPCREDTYSLHWSRNFPPSVDAAGSLSCLQEPVTVFSLPSHMNPIHTLICNLFYILLNSIMIFVCLVT
jgi:hypothetical protein